MPFLSVRSLLLISTSVLALGAVASETLPGLPALNIDLSQTSVSGISSGGFMTVQLHAAHASQIVGVGVFAGGPYKCAGEGNQTIGVGMALNVCMAGEADARASLQRLQSAWEAGKIDNPEDQKQDRIWLYSGYNDGVVQQSTMDALLQYYEQLTDQGHVYYKDNQDAGHAQIVDNSHGQSCELNGGQFINDCDYDGAGLLLRHIYGELKPRVSTDNLTGTLSGFTQTPYFNGESRAVMAKTGYLYVPQSCQDGEPCRLHIAFHGCLQNADMIGDSFYRYAGYNEWADNNHMVVLYPQTSTSSSVSFNPKGCWDWWGYSDPLALSDADYGSRDSIQIKAIWSMAEQLASGYLTPTASAATAATALELVAIDSSDDSIDLSWKAVAGGHFNLYRANAIEGPYILINTAGPITGSSYADTNLRPNSTLHYRLDLMDASNQPISSSAIVSQSTGAQAPACSPWFGTLDEHIFNGRAYINYWSWGWPVVATGSGQKLGSSGDMSTAVTLLKTGPAYYAVGNCPAN